MNGKTYTYHETAKSARFDRHDLMLACSHELQYVQICAGIVRLTPEPPGLYSGRLKAKRLLHQPVASTSANTTEWIPHGGEHCTLVHPLASLSDLGHHGVLIGRFEAIQDTLFCTELKASWLWFLEAAPFL
jgi:hypothetical protein